MKIAAIIRNLSVFILSQYFLLFDTDDSPMIMANANASMIAMMVQSIFILYLKVIG